MSIAIWWIRRDLRLADNPALASALNVADIVIPIFILDPKLLNSQRIAQKRITFLYDGMHALDASLRKLGSQLIIREGEPLEVLKELMIETQAVNIFAQADVSPYARRRDERVKNELPLFLMQGNTIHAPGVVLKSNGSPYTVFTPYSQKWHSMPHPGIPLPAPERLQPLPALSSMDIPSQPAQDDLNGFLAGEAEAILKINSFMDDGIYYYAERRNRVDLNGTSGLSPYLRFGMISARQAYWIAYETRATMDHEGYRGIDAWMNEIIWREFYSSILYHFPHVLLSSFRLKMRGFRWLEDRQGYEAWKTGHTGFPIVDAAMRQLSATGWIHNRLRMITASFLVKDLLIDWRIGERYFMQHLIDGDPASNNGGWQWTAGTGTDASPYFRVFNPVTQAKKFDPRGDYVRRWLPELELVPEEYIHTPWIMPDHIKAKAGCRIGGNYPAPIVDHKMARQRAIDLYKSMLR